MREAIEAALGASKADYTEIRLEEIEGTRVVFRGRQLETASMLLDKGGIVRCLVRGGGWGTATFNDLSDLRRRVEQAYEGARAIQGEPIELAMIPISQDVVIAQLGRDFRGVSVSDKKELAQRYNEILLGADPRIVDTQTAYVDSFSRVTIANSEGTYVEEERPQVGVAVSAIARQDADVQQAFESVAGPAGFETVLGHEGLAETVARRALDLLAAPRVKGGRYPVICNSKLAGVFIHEAFGHLSEADFVYSNPKAREMMALGRRFGHEILNVAEDGSVVGLRGTHRYDDEGTPTGRADLIKEGVLVGRLHSRETAAKLGERPTGNARATSYRFPPIVRMTNTFIEAGDSSFDEMIRDVDLGIYACDAFGGQTALENFSFSSAYAHMIRKGQIAEMVKDVILAGNLFATLDSIDAIGSDFRWLGWLGGCGKGQDGPLPVAMGAPHVRIRDVVVGGE